MINARLYGYLEKDMNFWFSKWRVSESQSLIDWVSKWTKLNNSYLLKKKTVEIFLHKQINNNTWDCLVYPWKKLKVWKKVFFEIGELKAEIKSISPKWRIVKFNKKWIEFLSIIEKLWEIPLPPYIKEKLENNDRYQTVYNEISWSVAAPTAGLHFTPKLLKKLKNAGVKIEKVLLHIWLGTFAWVETEILKNTKCILNILNLKNIQHKN